MTVAEALAKWTHCRQCGHPWKGNFTPEENDSAVPNLARKLRLNVVEVVEVKPEGMWPSAGYTAMVKVVTKAEPEQCFYLAVR